MKYSAKNRKSDLKVTKTENSVDEKFYFGYTYTKRSNSAMLLS